MDRFIATIFQNVAGNSSNLKSNMDRFIENISAKSDVEKLKFKIQYGQIYRPQYGIINSQSV